MPGLKNFFSKYIFIFPLLAGLCLSLFFSLFVNYDYNPLNVNDQGLHQRIAANLAHDFTFSGATGPVKPFCPVRSPLYPVLLAVIMKAAGVKWLFAVRAVQIILHLATIRLIWEIALCLYDRNRYAAFTASMTAALIPHTALLTHDVMSETLTIFLLAACIHITLKSESGPGYRNYLLLGICGGLLILTRPVFLLLLPLLWLYLFIHSCDKKAVFIRILLSAFSVMIIMLPWMIAGKKALHQYRIFQNSGTGFNLMFGIFRSNPFFVQDIRKAAHEFETDSSGKEITIRTIQTKYLNAGLKDIDTSTEEARRFLAISFMVYTDAWRTNPPEPGLVIAADNFLNMASISWIRVHPKEYLSVLPSHLKLLILEKYTPEVYRDLKGRAFGTSDYFKYVLYGLFLAGMVSGIKKGRVIQATLPLIVIIYILAIHLPMNAERRYFMPAYPVMALTAPMLILPAAPKKAPVS